MLFLLTNHKDKYFQKNQNLSIIDCLLIFLFKLFKIFLKELVLTGVLILPLKIKDIKYKPNLICLVLYPKDPFF
jgi:hypothetical protein